eukprot:NODE_4988_length_622_cov_269.430335.p2 GENE.NODE_4988_length_622_cov_269.430335~~NODE_4988_length_622_cov_269.430335.p2  ORF type:complete len:156 (-),score=8.68 NODE_4988_length_622_cov_269.430335:8-475(-)
MPTDEQQWPRLRGFEQPSRPIRPLLTSHAAIRLSSVPSSAVAIGPGSVAGLAPASQCPCDSGNGSAGADGTSAGSSWWLIWLISPSTTEAIASCAAALCKVEAQRPEVAAARPAFTPASAASVTAKSTALAGEAPPQEVAEAVPRSEASLPAMQR